MSSTSTALLIEEHMHLTDPDARYQDSYLSMLREHQMKGRFLDSRHIDNSIARLQRNFASFVDDLHASYDPQRLRPGRILERHFWLIADGREVVGRSTFRPYLSELPEFRGLGHIGYDVRPSAEGRGYGKAALRLTLEHAREAGLDRVLLTCDSTNTGSRKIIEACGGALHCAVPIPGRNYNRLHYWITL